MSQTRVSQLFKQKKTAKIKRKQILIDTFCVKKDRHLFDDEVICLNPRKKEETARPVGTPRKYDNSMLTSYMISMIYSSFPNSIMKSTVNSTLSRQNQNHTKKI